MKTFHVIDSTLSAKELGLYLNNKYKLSPESSCKFLFKGINDTYIISDNKEKFIFRVYSYNWRTEKEISEEIRLLNLLRENDISVSYPIDDREGEFIQKLKCPEGIRYGVLFSFAYGEKNVDLSLAQCRQIGQLMAKQHKIGEGVKLKRINYDFETLVENSFKKTKPFLSNLPTELAFLKTTKHFLELEFKKIRTDELRYGAIHLDLAYNNLHITDKGKITIFDFDFCGNGWLCNDIGYFVLVLFLSNKKPAILKKKTKKFLEGYQAEAKMSEEEKRILALLGLSHLFFYLGIQCERVETWSNKFLNEKYLKHYINENMKRWYEFNHLNKQKL